MGNVESVNLVWQVGEWGEFEDYMNIKISCKYSTAVMEWQGAC